MEGGRRKEDYTGKLRRRWREKRRGKERKSGDLEGEKGHRVIGEVREQVASITSS